MSKAIQLAKQRRKLEEASKYKKKEYPPFVLGEFLFDKQISFVMDEARFAVACCSVRAGKTMACAADLINTALTMPGTTGLYITLARTSAKTICWPELKRIIRDYGLECDINEADLTVHFTNDSWIRLYGGNEESEIEKIRGQSNVSLIYLDECQAFRSHIKYLVEDIVTKRLYDTNGRCRMIGTPGPIEAGYFYECTKSLQWARHHWTMFDNPWLLKKSGKTPQELTDADCGRRGITIDDPSIQRENFGRWKQDPNALLLSYLKERNDFELMPIGQYRHVIGIDLGQKDLNFISVLAYSDHSPITYLVEEKGKANQTTDDLANSIKELMKKYQVTKLVCDAGGLGLAIVNDLRVRHGLPIEIALKTEKMAAYAIMNNALRNGTLKAKSSSIFANDCNLLERDDDKSTPDKSVVKGHSDAVDAALYAFKFSPAYTYIAPPVKHKEGTPERAAQFQQEVMESNFERLERERKQKQGEDQSWHVDQDGVPDWNKWGNDY
jgi:hypothetical protein